MFVTYDPLFIPLLLLINSKLHVFEHNTTPEKAGSSKHAIWQRCLFKRINRLTQFPGQSKMLEHLNQNVSFVGTPVLYELKNKLRRLESNNYYLAPTVRGNISELNLVKSYLGDRMIIIKQEVYDNVLKDCALLEVASCVKPVEYIDIGGSFESIYGVIVTVTSPLRSSGWFNDSLAYGLPIITTNKNASSLFEDSFPNYPYIDITNILDDSEFHNRISIAFEFDTESYLEKHNLSFRRRFMESIG